MVRSNSLNPANKGPTRDGQPGLLKDFPFDCSLNLLVGFNTSSGDRPQTDARGTPSLDQEQVIIDNDDGTDGQLWGLR